MMRVLSFVLLLLMWRDVAAEPITLTAADGVKIYGEVWRAADARAPVILAFHQAGSSHAEYAPLAGRLNKAGFTVLAIDQRSGGNEFGGMNATVAAIGRSAAYDAALPDLAAALTWGTTNANGAPVLVWGSIYSAALVFVLAAQYPEAIAGVLAFSPGEYLGRNNAVKIAAAKVKVPVFVTQADSPDEIAEARAIVQATASTRKLQFVPTLGGVHGTSTLRTDRNKPGAEENWQAVQAFLNTFKRP